MKMLLASFAISSLVFAGCNTATEETAVEEDAAMEVDAEAEDAAMEVEVEAE